MYLVGCEQSTRVNAERGGHAGAIFGHITRLVM
jgi:hypothetical protein